VSIGIWHNLSSDEAREQHLNANTQLRKTWRAASKRFDAADESARAKLRFERSWLYTLLLGFLNMLYQAESTPGKYSGLIVCYHTVN
jgi:intron-binding protein aquarius